MSRLRKHLSFANVTAVLALVVALSGTGAYAATLITSAMIKNGTIQNVDIRNNTIQPGKLAPAARTQAYSIFYDPGVALAGGVGFQQVAQLTIPKAGAYVITATTTVTNLDSTYGNALVCTLDTGSRLEGARAQLQPYGTDNAFSAPLTIQIAVEYSAPGTATLSCLPAGTGTSANEGQATWTNIVAIRVSSLTGTGTPESSV